MQDALRALLRTLHEVASSEGIPYAVAYGTALGAARHGDLIPWDTDCDVVVPWSDLERLVSALNLVSEDHKAWNCDRDQSYDHLFPRFGFSKIEQNAVHIDLFPLVGTFKAKPLAIMHLAIATLIRRAYLLKRTTVSRRWGHDRRKRAIGRILKTGIRPVPASALIAAFGRLATMYRLSPDRPTLNLGGNYWGREIVPYSTYFPTSKCEFSQYSVEMPGDWRGYLTRMYGQYERIPPVSVQESALKFFYDVSLPKIMESCYDEPSSRF